MKKMIIAAAVLFAFHTSAQAERWSAAGILVTKIKGHEKTEFIELDGFDSAELCWAAVNRYSHTDERIGTDGEVKTALFNYDGDCFLKSDK